MKVPDFARWFGVPTEAPEHFRSVGRLVLLAGLVGTVAGLGAVAFQLLSRCIVHYGLEMVAGYQPTGPANESSFLFTAAPAMLGGFSPWLLLGVMTAGGLLSGLLVYKLAPEAEGHGTDAAIRAFHRNHGLIRPRVPLVKIMASALTIGSGGSGGREGPIAQIGAGFGSFLAVRLGLSEYERRLLLAAGMGAGIAAIFRAPLAGAIFASEVLYRDEDFESQALIPSFIASAVAYCVYGLVVIYAFGAPAGFKHIFSITPGLKFDNPLLLGPLAVLALVMVGAAILYVKSFYGLNGLFARLKIPPHFKPAVGALLAGLFAVGAYYAVGGLGAGAQQDTLNVLSFGYGILQKTLSGGLAYGPVAAIALLLVIGLGKILTTSLTIGSGGSGGVFGPSMVIGGTLGGAVGLVFQMLMPSVVMRIDVFVILGMAAFFSAAAKTPISTILIVSELTGGYELLVPAMWVAALAYLISGRRYTIYHEQVPSRVDSPAHQGEFIQDVLKGLTIGGIMSGAGRREFTSIAPGTTFESVMQLVPKTTQQVFPVVDNSGRFCGLLDLDDIRQFLYKAEMGQVVIVEDIMTERVEPLRPDTDLSSVMARFARSRYEELPIVDAEAKVIGLLSLQDIVTAYDRQLAKLRSPGV
jgi:CIC family chloride channel protein